MKLQLQQLLAIVILISGNNYKKAAAQDPLQVLDQVRGRVLYLQQTGQLNRENVTYYQSHVRDEEKYDFIIVGAGSSGSALTNRLSEVGKWKILLLEAGGEPDVLSEIPFWSVLTHYTNLNWGFVTEHEPNLALGLVDQVYHFPRGKGIGGSSLLNFMIFSRGVKEDYDRWAEMGNIGWSYEEVLPILKRLESCTISRQDTPYRGHNGPIYVEDPYVSPSGHVFVKAAMNAGYKYVDYNGRTNRGVSYIQATTKRGLRCSGEKCYLRPIRRRRNLTIRTNSYVTKVLIKHNKAYGVEYSLNGRSYRAYAKKEVILSAGAIQSPQILLLSGIGPREQLTSFGIRTIKDLPVGQKLYDHPTYYGLGFTFNQSIVFPAGNAIDDQAFIDLYNEGRGLLRSTGTAEGLLFNKSSFANTNRTDTEVIYVSTFYTIGLNLTLGGLIRLTQETYDNTFKSYEGLPAALCGPILLHPKSHGRLELRSANPFDHPKIYSGYFTDPEGTDMKTMIAAIRETLRVMQSPPFTDYGVQVMDTPVYGCGDIEYDTDEYWECAIRHLASTVFHPTTTCKMGPREAPDTVVDYKLRVHGIRSLRVADTSIIPTTMTGHTNVPAFLVGEKLADLLKEQYLVRFHPQRPKSDE